MPNEAEDGRHARLLRVLRRRRGLSQAALARLAHVPRRDVQRVEAGAAGTISLDRLRQIFDAVGGRIRFTVWWNGAAADRLLDERHAALVERAVTIFEQRGWKTAVEVSFAEYGERGSIDILAVQPGRRALAIVEVKSELGALEATNRILDLKERLGPKVAARVFGGRADVVGRLLVLDEASTNRRLVARHGRTMGAIYPARGREVRAWLRDPRRPIRGIWFLSDASSGRSVSSNRTQDPSAAP
jgi:transcriptional regulator with XRE-family HTH domain